MSTELIKTLREQTGARIIDCKEALAVSDQDLKTAMEWLRKKGMAQAAKRLDRESEKGVICAARAGKEALLLELSCETDFVAKCQAFVEFSQELSRFALQQRFHTAADLLACPQFTFQGVTASVQEALLQIIARVGENVVLKRLAWLEVEPGVVEVYVHNAVGPGVGRVGVAVALGWDGEPNAHPPKLAELAKQIAMHSAAMPFRFVTMDEVSEDFLEHERRILREQAAQENTARPAEVMEKVIEGRLGKQLQEFTLTQQKFIFNPNITIKEALAEISKEVGAPVRLVDVQRFEVKP